jgi:hypothetical protein
MTGDPVFLRTFWIQDQACPVLDKGFRMTEKGLIQRSCIFHQFTISMRFLNVINFFYHYQCYSKDRCLIYILTEAHNGWKNPLHPIAIESTKEITGGA